MKRQDNVLWSHEQRIAHLEAELQELKANKVPAPECFDKQARQNLVELGNLCYALSLEVRPFYEITRFFRQLVERLEAENLITTPGAGAPTGILTKVKEQLDGFKTGGQNG